MTVYDLDQIQWSFRSEDEIPFEFDLNTSYFKPEFNNGDLSVVEFFPSGKNIHVFLLKISLIFFVTIKLRASNNSIV